MIRCFSLSMILCFFLISAVSAGYAGEIPSCVGCVKAPDECVIKPDECYTFLKNGKQVPPSDIYIFNGDVIEPINGKSITIASACGEKKIDRKTAVYCDISAKKPGWLVDFLSQIWEVLEIKGKRKSRESSVAFTPMGGDKDKTDRACFPPVFLQISPLPFDRATLLYGEPVMFRWEPFDFLSCTKAKLIITPIDKTTGKSIEKDMKIGELICISYPFSAGTSYEWRVEINGKRSDTYHFSMLTEETSQNIRTQLREVRQKYANQCSEVKQTLYLQFLSDITHGLDLYTDSLRMLFKACETNISPPDCSAEAVLNEVRDRINKR